MRKLAASAAIAVFAVAASAQWSDNFDSYANGQQLHGVNGWEGWLNNPANGALVTNAQSSSNPHSVEVIGPNVDIVRVFSGATSGIWMMSGEVYIPDSYTNTANQGSHFILLNEYVGTQDWSVQMWFDSATDMVRQNGGSGNTFVETQVPIVYDQWVGFAFTIDLGANTVMGTYNGATCLTGQWYNIATGTAQIQAVDLFAWNSSAVYYDNLSLQIVPEPATFVALGVGMSGLLFLRRRR